jgi:hypothetical protein
LADPAIEVDALPFGPAADVDRATVDDMLEAAFAGVA